MTKENLSEWEAKCGFTLSEEEREGAVAFFTMMHSYEETLAACDTGDTAPMYRAGRAGAKAAAAPALRDFAADIAMDEEG